MIKTFFLKLKNNFLTLFFPQECLRCGKSNTWFCKRCLSDISIRLSSQKNYIDCNDYIDKIFIAGFYSDENLRKLIDLFKYHYLEDLKVQLGEILIKFVIKNNLQDDFKDFLLIPLPLHHRRFLERGFNQSELLTSILAKKFNFSVCKNVLQRVRYTRHQTLLNKKQRQKNIKNAFVVENNQNILGKNILLIDDVVTTGASLNEAARILRQAGAIKIWVMVLAKN